jgi:hypothetical protein
LKELKMPQHIRLLMTFQIFPVLVFFLFSLSSNKTEIPSKPPFPFVSRAENFSKEISRVYNNLHHSNFALPKLESFQKAMVGFYEMKKKGIFKKNILTLIDFSLSSNQKRLWVIDLSSNTIIFYSLVAHGRNTGDEFAKRFSNSAESLKSSLGFYSTGEIYIGKHGKSLRLDGLEKGVNDNARNRGIVIHAADYVSDFFIKAHHRLGRSQGCPALPVEFTEKIINTIKDKSCLYIYYPSSNS